MSELKCPAGMVLIEPKGAVHPDEPAFCIGKTEVTQEEDNRFWAGRLKKGFELLIKLVSGETRKQTNSQEAPLRLEAAKQIRKSDVLGVEVKSVVTEPKPQPKENMAGPRKPAVLRTWAEAREYCQTMYPGGDLPTNHQWDKNAVFEVDNPADVGSKPANPKGFNYYMKENVMEWTRDNVADRFRYIRGGPWDYYHSSGMSPSIRVSHPDFRDDRVGFRCVAPALSTVEGPPQDSKK